MGSEHMPDWAWLIIAIILFAPIALLADRG